MNVDYLCNDCKHKDTDVCCECPTWDDDKSCTCHTGNPPCSWCTDSLYEETSIKESEMKEQVFDVRVIARMETGTGDKKVDKVMDKIEGKEGAPLHYTAVSVDIVKELVGEEHGAKIATFRSGGYDVEYEIVPFLPAS